MQAHPRAQISLGPLFLVVVLAAERALAGAAAPLEGARQSSSHIFHLTPRDPCVWHSCSDHHYFGRFRFYGDHYSYYRGLGGIGYGLFLSRLPMDHSTVWHDGVPYQYVDGTYYQWNNVEREFEAVRSPVTARVLAFQGGGDYAR